MKYFEFGRNYEFYALIAADDEKSAAEMYEKDIDSLDDDFEGAKEISKEEANKKFAKCKSKNCTGFKERIKDAPCILLIDGELE